MGGIRGHVLVEIDIYNKFTQKFGIVCNIIEGPLGGRLGSRFLILIGDVVLGRLGCQFLILIGNVVHVGVRRVGDVVLLGGVVNMGDPAVDVIPGDELGQIAVDVVGDICLVTTKEACSDLEGRAPFMTGEDGSSPHYDSDYSI